MTAVTAHQKFGALSETLTHAFRNVVLPKGLFDEYKSDVVIAWAGMMGQRGNRSPLMDDSALKTLMDMCFERGPPNMAEFVRDVSAISGARAAVRDHPDPSSVEEAVMSVMSQCLTDLSERHALKMG
ncbi:MAG: hypothetical protein HY370_08060 [Proteobacteria bacterium]|nr:hypothetical protein [Pseudomonadota bacterium]